MDALEREGVERAVRDVTPDAIIHELTDLAGSDFAADAKLRLEGDGQPG